MLAFLFIIIIFTTYDYFKNGFIFSAININLIFKWLIVTISYFKLYKHIIKFGL